MSWEWGVNQLGLPPQRMVNLTCCIRHFVVIRTIFRVIWLFCGDGKMDANLK